MNGLKCHIICLKLTISLFSILNEISMLKKYSKFTAEVSHIYIKKVHFASTLYSSLHGVCCHALEKINRTLSIS